MQLTVSVTLFVVLETISRTDYPLLYMFIHVSHSHVYNLKVVLHFLRGGGDGGAVRFLVLGGGGRGGAFFGGGGDALFLVGGGGRGGGRGLYPLRKILCFRMASYGIKTIFSNGFLDMAGNE